MLKTVVILPDGTELSSGKTGEFAISAFRLTQCVNEAKELTLGSVCAAMVELTILTHGKDLPLQAGQEFTVCRQEGEIRHKVGIFIAEAPQKATAATVKITAYDRISRLDKDLTQWLESLTGWPYTLQQLSQMVCQQCGVALKETQLPNGHHPVDQFHAQAVTGRLLLRWIGELTGRFCRCDENGQLEFGWYTPKNVTVGEGELYFFQNGISAEIYETAPIEKLQLRQTEGDIGTVYPDIQGAGNTYIITGNPLAAANSAGALIGVAQTLYELLQDVRYTPCKLTIPASFAVAPGDILTVTDPKGNRFCTYIMSRRQQGNKDILESTGSISRSSTTAVNHSYQALSGKVLQLSATVDGLKAENRSAEGKMASLTLDVEGISSEVLRQSSQLSGVKNQLSTLEQTAENLRLRFQSGASSVTTETGFTFDESGLTVSKSDTRMENRLNESGMYVSRSGQVILQADQAGVRAVDVSVGNYLIVGDHARFEDYSSGADTKRTACFWI